MIVKLRILKSAVRKFPFDVIYLFGDEHRALLPRIFPWSLCLVVSDHLWAKLKDLSVQVHETRLHSAPRLRMSPPGITVERFIGRGAALFMLVPILPLTRRGMHKLIVKGQERTRFTPYLMAPQHAETGTLPSGEEVSRPHLEGILDDQTVLFTPHGPVRPVCLQCPRHLIHLQGLCHLGGKHCYDELVLWQPSPPTETTDGKLQEDHPDGDRAAAGDTP